MSSDDSFEFRITLQPTGRAVIYDLRNTIIITRDGRALIPDGPVTVPEMGHAHISCRAPGETWDHVEDREVREAAEISRSNIMKRVFEMCYGPTRPSK
jgi:hypothetical protein